MIIIINEKELVTLIHAVRIYSLAIRMEFGIDKYAMLIIKKGKRYMTDGMELPNQEKLTPSEKRKPTNTWENWKQIPSNERR